MKKLMLEPGDSTRYNLEFEETPDAFYVRFGAGDVDNKGFTRLSKGWLSDSDKTFTIDDVRERFAVDNMNTTYVLSSVLGNLFGLQVLFPESLAKAITNSHPDLAENIAKIMTEEDLNLHG